MKSKNIQLIGIILCSALILGATSTDTAIKTRKNTGNSPYQGLMASDTTNVSAVKIGTVYGAASSISIAFVGTDADGFTVSVYELPKKETGGTISWPSANKILKFTKLVTASSGEYAFETVSVNSNVGIGALFTGDIYITVSDFEATGEGAAWYVNIPVKSSSVSGGANY